MKVNKREIIIQVIMGDGASWKGGFKTVRARLIFLRGVIGISFSAQWQFYKVVLISKIDSQGVSARNERRLKAGAGKTHKYTWDTFLHNLTWLIKKNLEKKLKRVFTA